MTTKLAPLVIALTATLGALQGCTDDAVTAAACPPIAAPPSATGAAITATLDALKDKNKLNAIIFAAEQNGTPIVRTALGASNGMPATTDLHFRIGAVGWQYLSVVLLRMTEQQPAQIKLTDLVSKWYPDYPYANLTTVRMLAASSAGYGDYINAPMFLEEVGADPLRAWTADELIVRSVLPYQEIQFKTPGKDWKYSHTGFVMLGAILEKVSGKPYATLVRELAFEPLGFRETRLQFDLSPQLPILQTLEEEQFRDSTYWNPSFVSWAALTSNICELGAWNRAFGTDALLTPATKGQITAPVNVGLGGSTPQAYFGLGTIVYPPWIVTRAAYWGMYTTTAYDTSTGISLSATIALSPNSPSKIQPANEIITEISKILTPDHPVPQ